MFTIPLNLYIVLPLLFLQYLLARVVGRRMEKCGGGISGIAVLSGIAWGAIASFLAIGWMNFLWSTGNLLPHSVKADTHDVLLLVIAIPLIEEYLFRGVIFTWLSKYFRPATIIFITSLLFVVTHPGDQLLLLIFLVNVICGISRHITGSFASSWICRMIYNAASFMLLAYPVFFTENYQFIYLPLIIGGLLLISIQIFRNRLVRK